MQMEGGGTKVLMNTQVIETHVRRKAAWEGRGDVQWREKPRYC